MKLVELNWQPAERQLREFAVASCVCLPILGWCAGVRGAWLTGVLLFAMGVGVGGWLRPRWIRPIFLGLSLIAFPIGLVVGELALLAIFIGLFVPLSVCFRILRRDVLQRRRETDGVTYWQRKQSPTDVARYFRQY